MCVGYLVLRSVRFGSASFGFETRLVGPAVLAGGILAWMWPIGLGGRMPVGGDVTQFFLGLMDFYGESLKAGRLPVWNDLWGYGFPGLAESQMGVFYPVHLILYRWLNTETAYVVSLIAHTFWGCAGAYWAARRVGTSRMGSTLAAFCWTSCGFFLVHLAHPWGYTIGCWMPWAWGLGFSLLDVRLTAKRAYPIRLALVLALQLLPGHFQLAFITQCGLLLMVVWALIERKIGRMRSGMELDASAGRFRIARGHCRCARPGVCVSARGRATRADGAAGSTGRVAARVRVLIRFCFSTVPSRELCRAWIVSSLNAMAAPDLGSVPRHARGTSDLRRTRSALPCVHDGGS